METINEIAGLVGSLGFPIVMCMLMFNYMKTNNKDLTQAISTLTGVVNELKDMINILVNKD